jgi:hypothetical protein
MFLNYRKSEDHQYAEFILKKSVRAELFHQQFSIPPSPLAGEGGLRHRRKTDEGWAAGRFCMNNQ